MVVFSAFDGISVLCQVLKELGVDFTYFASEINKKSIEVSQYNHKDIIQVGNIKKSTDLQDIDLLTGGFPCQSFSLAGKQRWFDDKRGKLFFDLLRVRDKTKPKYFLFENVVMKKEIQDIISSYIGVEPFEIDSQLVSAQMRKRLYWTNLPKPKIEDKNITLQDITLDGWNKAAIIGRRIKDGRRKDNDLSVPTVPCLEVRATNTHKSGCLTNKFYQKATAL